MTSIMYFTDDPNWLNDSGKRPNQGGVKGAGPRSHAIQRIATQQRIGTSQSRDQRSPCLHVT
jgi:hypothetical protein